VAHQVTVGIPRSLWFYLYYPMWKEFFESLEVNVLPSPPTTREILDYGARETVSDACVPIKLFHGHVMELAEKDVDYIFIPRMVNVARDAVFCPKFLGLPDMVRCSLPDLPPIIDVRVDLRKGRNQLFKVALKVGRLFTSNTFAIRRAYGAAVSKFKEYQSLVKSGIGLNLAMDILERGGQPIAKPGEDTSLTFAVLGYPYNIYDQYVSVDVIGKLNRMGVKVVTTEMLPQEIIDGDPMGFKKDAFWILSHRALNAGYHFFKEGGVDGIIHLTAFGCGPDFMVNKLFELKAKECRSMPFMTLMIDEQTGDAGVLTRLQAFTDMVRLRKSPVGQGGLMI
jgi:predicted nucleotide-binding protein (sugar kinase/HSP70/actin superfamily)